MKRIFAITFLSIYLFSATELYQYFKLPALIEHYSEHQQKDTNITLWKFLCMHYAKGEVKDKDFEKDMKLPFKTAETHSGFHFTIILQEPKVCFTPIFYYSKKSIIKKYSPIHFNSNYLNAIWQPPKSC